VAPLVALDQFDEVAIQCGDPLRVAGDRPVDRDGRAVAGLEIVAEIGRRGEQVHRHRLSARHNIGHARAEQRADVALATP